MLAGLSLGRIVRYVLQASDLPETHQRCVGEVVPAIVVNDWASLNRDDGYANLVAIVDGSNHGVPGCTLWATSRVYSKPTDGDAPTPGTWHWPSRPGVNDLAMPLRTMLGDNESDVELTKARTRLINAQAAEIEAKLERYKMPIGREQEEAAAG